MSKQQHPTHHPAPSQPGAEPSIGVGTAADQRDRDGRVQGIVQDIDDTLSGSRVTDGGIETLPPKSDSI